MVSVPVRPPPVFAPMLNVTVPLPAPDAPPVTVIQLTFETAVQAHPAPAVTATDPVDADAATLCDVVERE